MSARPAPLSRLIEGERARWQRLQLLEAVGLAIAGIVAYFLAAVLLDHFARLPMIGRLLVAAGLVAACAACGRLVWRRWKLRSATEDEVALAIERRTPGGVQNRLINALQIGRERDGPAAALAEAIVEDNWRHLEQDSLQAAAPARPAAVAAGLAVGLLALFIAGWLWQPARFATAASRILLPFAAINPLYRTVLVVEPGDIEAEGDVPIRIRIQGERPAEIAILLDEQGRRSTHPIAVPAGPGDVDYTIPNVTHSLTYAVSGGDFTSPSFRIDVPTPARLARVRATYHYPAYTKLADKTVESSGDLEAVAGTRADILFVLDNPAEAATLIFRAASGTLEAQGAEQRVELQPQPATESAGLEFHGQLALDATGEYRLETRQPNRRPHATAWHSVRSIVDEPPKVELAGLPSAGEATLDAPMSLRAIADDDFGVTRLGLFARMAGGDRKNDNAAGGDDQGWLPVAQWPADGATKAAETAEFLPADAGAVEGDRLELVARAMDAHPDRAGQWTKGQVFTVLVAGDGAQLQVLYERILRSEAELTALVDSQRALHAKADQLVRQLDADPQADGNQPERVQEILAWATDQSRAQGQTRETAAQTAKDMPQPAGNLRLSLGMLADTEMIRALRALDSVATRDDAAGRRTAIAEGRATQQRTLHSLEQILDQYVHFRQEWELAHMTPFLRMLADRQATLRDISRRRAEPGDMAEGAVVSAAATSTAQHEACARRQAKLAELCGLAAVAFAGMSERTVEIEEELATAFGATSDALTDEALSARFDAAGQALAAADWATAAEEQRQAAESLEGILTRLQEAQTEAARRALAGLQDRADSDLQAQAALEQLQPGDGEDLLDEPAGLALTDIIHLAEVERAKEQAGETEPYVNDYLLPDSAIPSLQQPDTGKRQEFDILKLAKAPGKTPSFPKQSDRAGNRVKPHIQEEFEDLVGDLLEEEDEMQANYETFNLNAAFNINEPGEIGKQGGDLNSTAAAAATGNQKPPTTNVGGASRVGRQGARAHGAAVGNESINRRGRDKVQEGQERSPDQAGSVKETKSDDPQEDTSTGIGGRKVESDDAKFSQNDTGEWTDDMVDRMDKPQATQYIVERQGDKLAASVADRMRDMTSKQEQTLERLKTIRKELKNLYLPTDHLDELIEQMQANLNSLGDRPSVEVFRLQQQTLEEIAAALSVFHQAHSGFQASLARDQAVRGRVIDDPARSAPPGYEEAVREYYRRLTAP